MDSEECTPKLQPPLIDNLKSMCLYILKDLGNNELFTYTGKDSNDKHLSMVLASAEIELDENPVMKAEHGREIPFHPKTTLNHKEAYIFIWEQSNKIDIIYWIGTQSTRFINIQTANNVAEVTKKVCEKLFGLKLGLHVTRKTSESRITNYGDVLSVFQKTPRLYRVAGPHTIRQIQLIYRLVNEDDSYVLDDSLSVTVYHSPTSEMKRKIADSLAKYIVNVENDGNYNLTVIPPSDDIAKTALKTFCSKILSAVQVRTSKTNSLPKNSMGNSKVVNKLSNEDVIAIAADFAYFEEKKRNIFVHLKKNMILSQTGFIHNDRISSTATASSSTLPKRTDSGKKSKGAKGKITSKVEEKSSFLQSVFEREPTNVATTSTVTVRGNNKYENVIPIFMGSEECAPKTQLPLIDTLKSVCVYILKDIENNELFIYFGKDSKLEHLKTAMVVAEIDLDENPSVKVTTCLEGNTIPTHFMIHIEDEIRKHLRKY